ncbi:hypothetical protein EIN_079400 [Entamoeba invadens IP1]|uniref:hypothetical protein n=1 Tax=Entamoeba invadens IP1 TaxID=370355 RepID=UPI0002C3D9AD|nr:hypothetical protein EIN_079400 [Entamoeba invadens IP1]ELP85018.1 hypothetical protein EIN_079400 [Entamoeba invadens IP1]|eukprot:XP_004184364.1 hypothetical protein EIN_079400 [Entamoeba invadens IP1]
MQLEYLDLSNNVLTNIDCLTQITTLTYLNVENNQLTRLPKLVSLSSLNISNNPITDDKSIFMDLRNLTNLTSLSVNPSSLKQKVDIVKLFDNVTTVLSLETKKKSSTDKHLLDSHKEYLTTILSSKDPDVMYCSLYTRLLVLLLPHLKVLNTSILNMSVKNEVNDSIQREFKFYKPQNVITSIKERKSNGIYCVNPQQGPTSQFSESVFQPIFTTIKDPRQIEFSKLIPGISCVSTRSGELFYSERFGNSVEQLNTEFTDFSYCTFGRTQSTSKMLVRGGRDGSLSIYNLDVQKSPMKTLHDLENINSLCINVDSSNIVTSGYLNNIFVFDFTTGCLHRVIGGGHSDDVNGVSTSWVDPNLFSSASDDHMSKIWDLRTNCQNSVFNYEGETALYGATFAKDNMSLIISGVDNYVADVDIRTGKSVAMKLEKSWCTKNKTCAINTQDGEYIVSVFGENVANVSLRSSGLKILDLNFQCDLLSSSRNGGLINVREDPWNEYELYFSHICRDNEQKYSMFKCSMFA